MGLLGMLLPAADSGIRFTAVDAAIVFEQLGSHLVPGPVLWTLLAASLVEGAATGVKVIGGVEADSVVDGAAVVEHAAEIDVVLVFGNDGIFAHDLSGMPTPTPLTAVDPLTTFGRITGLDTGRRVGDSTASDELRSLGTLLAAAMLAGISSRSLEVARQYALERHQFNAPIGSFQAVKHMLADMYVRSVSAQSPTYAASAIVDDPGSGDPVRAVASAKLLAADAAIVNADRGGAAAGGHGIHLEHAAQLLAQESLGLGKRVWRARGT